MFTLFITTYHIHFLAIFNNDSMMLQSMLSNKTLLSLAKLSQTTTDSNIKVLFSLFFLLPFTSTTIDHCFQSYPCNLWFLYQEKYSSLNSTSNRHVNSNTFGIFFFFRAYGNFLPYHHCSTAIPLYPDLLKKH